VIFDQLKGVIHTAVRQIQARDRSLTSR